MSKIILMQGLPGSGKSTRAKELSKHGNTVRIGRDQLRDMLHFGEWSGKNEEIVRKAQANLADFLLKQDKVVIIDDTNIQPARIQFWKDFARERSAKIEWERMETPICECILRDSQRAHPIGKNVITAMALQAGLYPKPEKGFVLCDLDGTLCDISHRLHHVKRPEGEKKDWKSFFADIPGDTPRQDVLDMILKYEEEGHEIVFVSARPNDHRKATEVWLENLLCGYDMYTTLIMRREGDTRTDTEVKKQMLDQFFRENGYPIAHVIDDRPSVIRMWRAEGLHVIDVGSGVEF